MSGLPAKVRKTAVAASIARDTPDEGADGDEDLSRRGVAKFLLRRLNEANSEQYGISKIDLCKLREVANGAREKDRRSSEGDDDRSEGCDAPP